MHVFVDESERGAYLVCAVLVNPNRLHQARSSLRQLLCPGERRIHFNTERPSRRRALLSALTSMDLRARIYLAAGRPVEARHACLDQLVCDLATLTAPVRLVIESRSDIRDGQDRHTIFSAQRAGVAPLALTYEHLRPHEDPLLRAADALVWAYGAGGDWRRRIEPLLDKVTVLD